MKALIKYIDDKPHVIKNGKKAGRISNYVLFPQDGKKYDVRKDGYIINCTECGDRAVTLNMKKCIRTGCKGTIFKIPYFEICCPTCKRYH